MQWPKEMGQKDKQ